MGDDVKKLIFIFIFLALSFHLTAPGLFAFEGKGKLESFEDELEKDEKPLAPKKKPKPKYEPEESGAVTETETTAGVGAGETAMSGAMGILSSIFLMGLTQGGTSADTYHDLKERWSPALPTVYVLPAYQYIINNVHGYSVKAEIGYLMFGVDMEWVNYFEKNVKSTSNMRIVDGHFLLRSMFTDFFGVNVAIGAKTFWGESHHTGFDFGFPFYIYPSRHFIVDIQPFMAAVRGRDVYDIGGGVSYKYKYIGARAGYRLIRVGGQNLHGPNAGIFFQY